MLLSGDEILRSKQGNNNTYCQNNELSWIDWHLAEQNDDMLTFTRALIAFRQRHPTLRRKRFLTGRPEREDGLPDISWHGVKLDDPGWDDGNARVLAFTLAGLESGEEDLHVMLNMWEEPLDFAVPSIAGRRWHKTIDTADSPSIREPKDQPKHSRKRILVQGRSVVVLEAR